MPAVKLNVGGPGPQYEEVVSASRGQIGAIDPTRLVPIMLSKALPPPPPPRRRPPPLPPLPLPPPPRRRLPPLPPLPPMPNRPIALRISLAPPSLQAQLAQAQARLRPASARKMPSVAPVGPDLADVLRFDLLERRKRIEDDDEDEDVDTMAGGGKGRPIRRRNSRGFNRRANRRHK